MFELQIDELRIDLKGGAVEACRLKNHAVVQEGVGHAHVLCSLATIVFENRGEQADCLAGLVLGQNAGSQCEVQGDARNSGRLPDERGGLVENPLIVKQASALQACIPIRRICLQLLAWRFFRGEV